MGVAGTEFERLGRLRTSRDHSKTSHEEGVPVGREGDARRGCMEPRGRASMQPRLSRIRAADGP